MAARWGKIVARRAFGDAGPRLDADLATLEQVAVAAARGLLDGTLATLLEQQAQSLSQRSSPAPPAGGRVRATRTAAASPSHEKRIRGSKTKPVLASD